MKITPSFFFTVGISSLPSFDLILATTRLSFQNYVPTVFENYTASFEIEKQRIELNMWDTSGEIPNHLFMFSFQLKIITPEWWKVCRIIKPWWGYWARSSRSADSWLLGVFRNFQAVGQKHEQPQCVRIICWEYWLLFFFFFKFQNELI